MLQRTVQSRLAVAGVLVFAVYGVGVAWYTGIEGWSLLDGAFMAMQTMTTVGYGQVHPLDTSGRVFTILYIPLGVGSVFYFVGMMVEDLLVHQVAETYGLQRLGRRIRKMRDHVVICGYGRVGQEVAAELAARGEQVLVIDLDAERLEVARRAGLVALHGDATDETVLREAQVESARVLIAAADSDTGNAFIALTGRALNPRVLIIARAGSEAAERRLITAGADRVISPTQIAGRRIALAAVQPLMVDFLESLSRHGSTSERLLAEFVIEREAAHLAGKALSEAFAGLESCRVLGLERADGTFVVGPDGHTMLQAGDRLMIYGDAAELETFRATGGTRLAGVERA